MSLAYDQKEDLRLRMADLERKLAESEEERYKLEKTCNVLMRAFREEEKMQYKALNRKYEKFLEDCSIRKRRNDIILRSLGRIEDRSRALYAKTERLKLLKDRYISYLKISDVKKGETHYWRTFPYSSPSQRVTNNATPKYVQWTTPLATHCETDRLKEVAKSSPLGNGSSDVYSEAVVEKFEREKSNEKQRYEGRKGSGINSYNGITNVEEAVRTLSFRDELSPRKTGFGSGTVPTQIRNENRIKPENAVSENYIVRDKEENALRGKTIDYDESIERVKALLSEEEHFIYGNIDERHDPYEGEIVEKDDLEQSEKDSITEQNKLNDERFPINNYNFITPSPNTIVDEREKQDEPSDNKESDIKADLQDYQEEDFQSYSPPKALPMGLDGVDYQNETYPESYYEQPVHHNHTNIASDVILEEDETEQECEEEAKGFTSEESFQEARAKGSESNTCARSPEHGAPGEPGKEIGTSAEKGQVIKGQVFGEVKSQKSEFEKGSETKQSDKNDGAGSEKSDKTKTAVKSNLIHLLESDSESFQIEHGDAVSGNEDSDFDFSFRQN